jgi:hypothetical protein
MDGKLKSKRTGQEWSTPQEYFSYAVSKAATPEQRQALQSMGADKVWQSATSSDKFEVVAPAVQPSGTSTDNSFMARLADNINRIPYMGVPDIGMLPGVRRTEVMKNMPGSAWNAVSGVVMGVPAMIGAAYDVGKDVIDQRSLTPVVQAGKGAIKAIAKDYGDYYLGDDVSGNIEKDPFRVVSDIAAIATAGITASPRLRAAAGARASLAGMDAATLNPMQLIPSSEAISNMQEKIGKLFYRKSLNLPRNVPMPERKEIAEFGVERGIKMSEAGQEQAGALYGRASSGMKQASQQEELKGTLIDPAYSKSKVDKAVSEFDIDPVERQYAERISDRTMQNVFPPSVFPNTPGPITPMMAERVKEKLNKNLEKLQGNRNRLNTTKSSIAESVKMSILDGIREAQGHAITDIIMIDGKPHTYREAGKVASLSKKLENIAESLVALMDTSAAGTASMTEGAAVGSALRGQMLTPAQIGWISKYVMRPEVMSNLGIELVKASKSGSKADKIKSAAIPIGAAARMKSRSDRSQEDPDADEPSPFKSGSNDEDEPSPFVKR